MTVEWYIIASAFVAASPVLMIITSKIIGIESKARDLLIKVSPALSSIGGFFFVSSSLFLASNTIGEIAGLGIVPGLVIWYSIQNGVVELTIKFADRTNEAR